MEEEDFNLELEQELHDWQNRFPTEQDIINAIENNEIDKNNILIRLAINNRYLNLLRIILQDHSVNLDMYIEDIIEYGDVSLVELLMQHSLVNLGMNYNSPLRIAIYNNYIEIVRLLLTDSNVNPADQNNYPIKIACGRGDINRIEIVRLLLADRRVNPGSGNNESIINASQYGHIEIVRLLLTNNRVNPSDQNNEAIRLASLFGHTEIVRLLLTDLRVKSGNLDNSFLVACQQGHIEIVKLLLQNQVHPSIDNSVALRYAVEYNRIEVIKLLLEIPGINPTAIGRSSRYNDNYSPLFLAGKQRNIETIKLLLNDIRVDRNPSDINYNPLYEKEDENILKLIETVKRNKIMKDTLAQYRNTIKENENTIRTIRFASPDEYPFGGIYYRDAYHRFKLNRIARIRF